MVLIILTFALLDNVHRKLTFTGHYIMKLLLLQQQIFQTQEIFIYLKFFHHQSHGKTPQKWGQLPYFLTNSWPWDNRDMVKKKR